jgi:hypothetical protein
MKSEAPVLTGAEGMKDERGMPAFFFIALPSSFIRRFQG